MTTKMTTLLRWMTLAGAMTWALVLAAVPVGAQVSADVTLGPDGTGRLLVDNPGAAPQVVRVEVWESDEDAPDGVELTHRVPGAVVWPDSFPLAPGAHQTVRLAVPVDSLGYAPGTLLRVRTTFAPPPLPEAERAQTDSVRTVLRRVVRYVTRLTVSGGGR